MVRMLLNKTISTSMHEHKHKHWYILAIFRSGKRVEWKWDALLIVYGLTLHATRYTRAVRWCCMTTSIRSAFDNPNVICCMHFQFHLIIYLPWNRQACALVSVSDLDNFSFLLRLAVWSLQWLLLLLLSTTPLWLYLLFSHYNWHLTLFDLIRLDSMAVWRWVHCPQLQFGQTYFSFLKLNCDFTRHLSFQQTTTSESGSDNKNEQK